MKTKLYLNYKNEVQFHTCKAIEQYCEDKGFKVSVHKTQNKLYFLFNINGQMKKESIKNYNIYCLDQKRVDNILAKLDNKQDFSLICDHPLDGILKNRFLVIQLTEDEQEGYNNFVAGKKKYKLVFQAIEE